ncbi:type I-E CRISPR-associated protein Cse1/CasA [Amycolatopsis acidicola]|uniref:Type I-E CRISPR-associated protein Cse1/CasA n=1 Tax=Amycolatopsis acidicola TaxID=2596893 RepID=A0A5N0UYI9_9PSEU|nr:type I-E CRISPR-associated protein Cse1/CasA [Amycolatopsis acidicola]KAA9157934.1 type I-E CRISPR-associated protein Cse1/CasA [Amycolatopsis acidicola]
MSASFDLITEPWVPVTRLDGSGAMVGLAELFTSAHTIRGIVGETPPMTAALHRLALALLHRVYGPARRQDWAKLWSAEAFDTQALERYLATSQTSFDLFDPERPFLQCPTLPSAKKSTVAKLIPDRAVGNNVTLFDHTIAGDYTELDPGAAARWLVTAHAYDPGGMKTPATTVKSSKRAPCNNFAVVLVEGGDLKQTLLLNAVRYDIGDPDDAPGWEHKSPGAEPDKRRPGGRTDLLTWPSRRIRLFPAHSNGKTVVSEAIMSPGTELDGKLPDIEAMAAYRVPRTISGKPKPGAPLLPVQLEPVRGVWRHSVELLLVDSWAEERARQRPGALKQLADLAEHGHIPADTVYTLRVFGQRLDTKASVVEGYFEETVPAPVALIRAKDDAVTGLVGTAIELADDAGYALRAMQRNYRKDMRAEPASVLDLGYWPILPRPFATFLRALNNARATGQSERSAMTEWQRTVLTTVRAAADDWAAGVTTDGRSLSMLGKHQQALHKRLRQLATRFDAQIAKYLTKDTDE